MDKNEVSNVIQYTYDSSIITVERCFIGKQYIVDMLKQYILELSEVAVTDAAAMYPSKEGVN